MICLSTDSNTKMSNENKLQLKQSNFFFLKLLLQGISTCFYLSFKQKKYLTLEIHLFNFQIKVVIVNTKWYNFSTLTGVSTS